MKIALIGYGKMGKMIEQIALQRGHEIVSIIDVDNPQDYDTPEFASADVAIEFTTPKAAYANYLKAWDKGVKVVSGSTGWKDEHLDDVTKATDSGKTLFWASNFSIGVAIFSAVNRYLAKIMDGFGQYDVSMSETHHVHKLDAPSGTAITLAEDIMANLRRKDHWTRGELITPTERDFGDTDDRIDQGIIIDSYREGEVPGIHTITYESDADIIRLTHSAHSRQGFALGAVLAAEYTAKHTGLLTISDMFKF